MSRGSQDHPQASAPCFLGQFMSGAAAATATVNLGHGALHYLPVWEADTGRRSRSSSDTAGARTTYHRHPLQHMKLVSFPGGSRSSCICRMRIMSTACIMNDHDDDLGRGRGKRAMTAASTEGWWRFEDRSGGEGKQSEASSQDHLGDQRSLVTKLSSFSVFTEALSRSCRR